LVIYKNNLDQLAKLKKAKLTKKQQKELEQINPDAKEGAKTYLYPF
jgi:hypothetical protein